MNNFVNALGLDVGEQRIGVARINSIAQIAEPLTVLPNNSDFRAKVDALIAEHSIDVVVVGMPRNMQGEKTKQSTVVENFARDILKDLGVPVVFQDETLSTVTAASTSRLPKNMEDAVAAGVILEDFVR